MIRPIWLFVLAALSVAAPAQSKADYEKDVAFAIDEVGKQCKDLLTSKKIDWKKVSKPLLVQSKKTKTDAEHLLLLWRLLARLQDGHAAVQPLPAGKNVKLDLPDRSGGPGLFVCRIGDGVFVKNAWGPAASSGLAPGMQIVAIDGKPAADWLTARREEICDLVSFSTPQQAEFYTCHWGLADAVGTRVAYEVQDGGAKKKRTVTFGKVNQVPNGPAFPPAELQKKGDIAFGKTAQGFGYLHIRRCKAELPELVDEAIGQIGDVPGMILDFRGNGGGGFDHEALFGRFLAKDEEWRAGTRYRGVGAHCYLGPVVVIVDGNTRSAGETAAGIFTEDGRAYGIGESATAGMSSQKTTIELPSKLFALYVSTHSNKGRFQGGKGIEGLGVEPHEIVPFAAADLAAQRDTLIARAEALLGGFPADPAWKKVRFDPREHGFAGK